MNYKCAICGIVYKNASALTAHVVIKHKLNSKEYYDKYLKKPGEGICLICGKTTRYTRLSTGYKKIHYKFNEILFASKWELAYYIWLKDHNINFKYQLDAIEYEFEGMKKHYVPDFEVNGKIQEIKGLHFFENCDPTKRMINPYRRKTDTPDVVKRRDDLMEAKHQCMIRNNVEIITDCSKYIEYVETKYGKSFFKEHKIKK